MLRSFGKSWNFASSTASLQQTEEDSYKSQVWQSQEIMKWARLQCIHPAKRLQQPHRFRRKPSMSHLRIFDFFELNMLLSPRPGKNRHWHASSFSVWVPALLWSHHATSMSRRNHQAGAHHLTLMAEWLIPLSGGLRPLGSWPTNMICSPSRESLVCTGSATDACSSKLALPGSADESVMMARYETRSRQAASGA